ncbi:hypothetical protein A4X09_0g7455 [Tilletia walkeri]|uniref:Uncharacterized protein n=1 Tax=Tilletia walkeri TaxID=117179 RepID=A0A8X7N3G7_9BASI|nr:hypothetical protein A4X09_0g7455 [Tilletia walkeri]
MSSAAAAGGDAPPPAAGGGSGQKKKGAKSIEKGQFRAKGGVSATTAGAGGGARKRSTVAFQPQPPGSRQRQDDLRFEDAHTQPRRPLSKNNSVSGLAAGSENSAGVVVVAVSWPSTSAKRGKQVLASHAGSRRTEAGGGAEEENQGEQRSGEPSSSSASSSSYSSTDSERPSGMVDSFLRPASSTCEFSDRSMGGLRNGDARHPAHPVRLRDFGRSSEGPGWEVWPCRVYHGGILVSAWVRRAGRLLRPACRGKGPSSGPWQLDGFPERAWLGIKDKPLCFRQWTVANCMIPLLHPGRAVAITARPVP